MTYFNSEDATLANNVSIEELYNLKLKEELYNLKLKEEYKNEEHFIH